MKRLTFIIVCIFLLVIINLCLAQSQKGMKRPQNQPDMPDIVYRKGWALIIGIDKYPNLPQYQLNWSVADAEAFANLLSSKFGFEKDNITILKNEQATKANIMEKLNSYADTKLVSHEDCVLFYFSGHGQTVSLPRGSGEMGFIIPYDAKISDLSDEPNLAEYRQYCIDMNELNNAAKTIPAKHIIFIVDSCYSGLVLNSTRGFFNTNIPRYLSRVASAETQQMITAGGKGELSEERPDLGHGVFTYKLLKGLDEDLADTNDDGIITGTELSTYLMSAVQEMTDGKQNPRYGRANEGEFLFIPQKPVVNTGKLVIQVYPSDAVVTVKPLESKESSFNALASEIEVPIGTYSLTAEKDGYETLSKDQVKVTKATPTQVNLILKQKPPPMATIDGQYLTQDTQIFVNGSRITLPYKTAPGTYSIRLERSGYNPIEMNANLTTNQLFSPKPEWVSIPKPPDTGILQMQVNPMDARVSVASLENSMSYDLTSNEIELPPGRYVATAKRDTYNSEVKDFKITANQRTFLTFTLKSKQPVNALATLKSDGLPIGSRVFVDGSLVTLPNILAPGPHSIRFERDGFMPYEKKEVFNAGQELNVVPLWNPLRIQQGISQFVAFSASMIVPGLGQHLQGHKMRGIVYEGLVLGSGLFALIADSRHHSTLDDYTTVRSELENKANIQMRVTPEIKALFQKQDDAYNKAKSAKNLAIVSQVMFFTAWGFNAFDAGFLIKPVQNNSGLAMDIQPISDGAIFIVKASF